MSIPPLVCSTPPPPDQCEDDKDPEDFDLSYNLSQDDDENNDYDYGNFSTYNHYQSTSDNSPLELKDKVITTSIQSEVLNTIIFSHENSETEQTNVNKDVTETNETNENKLKCEEDINIEDLNLKVDEDITTSIVDNSDENESSEQNADSLKDFNIPCNSNSSSQDDDVTNASFSDNVIEPTTHEETNIDETNVVESSNDVNAVYEHFALESDDTYSKENKIEFSLPSEKVVDDAESKVQAPELPVELQHSENQTEAQAKDDDDDDFGEFDDFQFVNTKSNVTTVVDSSNPWENTESTESDFCNFTANFEENKFPVQMSLQETVPASSNEPVAKETEPDNNIDDDDFGDFEDFKSPSTETESKEPQDEDPCQHFSVLNLQSTDNEHHIMETITKVITSVFLEEISMPESEFEGKLESLMGETWGHLRETDERQPYIVNWNNSLGQKTLLKSLCIDSRNILFGPKWGSHSSHMPKYAANLSNAPLQPQKQLSSAPSYPPPSEAVPVKASSKPTTWSDPYTADGQEFTYAEALLLDLEHLMATLDQMAHNHSTLKISELLSQACNTESESSTITPRPTDLDVFEAAIPSKCEKIYSSTIGVQPIRQISLPDTHIFTPTDSKIPRSKTIHYDQSPAILLPQSLVVDSKNVTDTATQNTTNVAKTSPDNDNEYWEFQDFKSTSDSVSLPGSLSQPSSQQEKCLETATIVNALPKPNIAYQTELLQPIKVEPSMPSLNWPDPGEIKVAYDDFSDFVSITPQSTERQDTIQSTEQPPVCLTATNKSKAENLNDLNEKTQTVFVETKNTENEGIDDDFDTFQSAAPAKCVSGDFKTDTFVNSSTRIPLNQFNEFECSSPKMNSIQSDTISFENIPRSKEALTQNIGFSNKMNTPELTGNRSVYSGTQSSLLQPTPAGVVNQRTTGQILQPLSLESYSQINWPSPGIDLQDLSRFNPVETLQSLKSDLSVSGVSKVASPVHTQKNTVVNHGADDDVWGEFVSSKPKQQQPLPKKQPVFAEDDEWTDFISSPSVKPQNGLNTISLNVHTNSNMQKTAQTKFTMKNNQTPVDIPTLNYITPKTHSQKSYSDKHFQNL